MKENEYITSDHHWGHANILKFSNRPFKDVYEMNEALIRAWNAKVPSNGVVYYLGDFAFMKNDDLIRLRKRLNGTIRLIKGNHDDKRIKGKVRDCFEWVKDYHETKIDIPPNGKFSHFRGVKVVMCHYPFLTWNKSHRNSWCLHGHCHNNLRTYPDMIAEFLKAQGQNKAADLVNKQFGVEPRRLDVGVDGRQHDFAPWSFTEIAKVMETRGHVVIDHHE